MGLAPAGRSGSPRSKVVFLLVLAMLLLPVEGWKDTKEFFSEVPPCPEGFYAVLDLNVKERYSCEGYTYPQDNYPEGFDEYVT